MTEQNIKGVKNPPIDTQFSDIAAKQRNAFLAFLCALSAAACWIAYQNCCSLGFTLDEFSHLPYLYEVFNGHPEVLLKKIVSPFSNYKIDGLHAYRPLMVLSLALDYFAWGAKPFMWHLNNIAIFSAVVFATGLFTFDLISTKSSNRYSKDAYIGAVFASLLMAFYPGHIDSVITIAGRNDTLATLFYVLCICCYFRYRACAQAFWQRLGLALFVLALSSKEIAATLPSVLLVAEMLQIFDSEKHVCILVRFRKAWIKTIPHWLTLIIFTILRATILHSIVGGYGKLSCKTMINQFLQFADGETLKRIFLPINEHFPVEPIIGNALNVLYAFAFIVLIAKCVVKQDTLRIVAFMLFFVLINVLPAFQIWHIYPNLVGCRLFFLASTSLASLMALALIPDTSKKTINTGCIAAFMAISLIWSFLLHHNIYPFCRANNLMEALRSQIYSLTENLPHGEKLIVTDLPQDYCGAPMLGKAVFLATNLRPPFTKEDYTDRVIVLQNGDYLPLSKDGTTEPIKITSPSYVYRWSNEDGRFTAYSGADISESK